jgi:hypothetical protein
VSKIIIHNKTTMRDSDAVDLVARVIRKGFISGEKQYCLCTVFNIRVHAPTVVVYAEKTQGETHTFKVIQE